jgi:phage repressor protein C with HTH and peptisase S24 domain
MPEVTPMTRNESYVFEVFGEAMEPQYFAGEVVYVDPLQPIGRGDFVVAQMNAPGEKLRRTRINRLVSFDDKWLTLEQYNPKRTFTFPSRSVVSVHKIVMGGERRMLN